MAWYFAKLALLLPLLALLIWGSLKLTKYAQNRLATSTRSQRSIQLVETCMLGPGMRLAVIEFRGREILLGTSRQGLVRLAEADVEEARATDENAREVSTEERI
ncbi:flagellar biosynthetic protein FliO [Qipengyuania sp. DGS5-3]|uniref:flagellar biosynthetic protein FliO n=1 Tax=Qipengyuania sp. DGS5-3 TaxID=3349632 RepID=UPI0036D395B0